MIVGIGMIVGFGMIVGGITNMIVSIGMIVIFDTVVGVIIGVGTHQRHQRDRRHDHRSRTALDPGPGVSLINKEARPQ